MLTDPDLRGVSAIVFDEFHERHLFGDITLARALQIQSTSRPDLIILVMSATLDVAAVQNYLQPCALLSSAGRTYSGNGGVSKETSARDIGLGTHGQRAPGPTSAS
jgi:ATP-dependent helicase HrpB